MHKDLIICYPVYTARIVEYTRGHITVTIYEKDAILIVKTDFEEL